MQGTYHSPQCAIDAESVERQMRDLAERETDIAMKQEDLEHRENCLKKNCEELSARRQTLLEEMQVCQTCRLIRTALQRH